MPLQARAGGAAARRPNDTPMSMHVHGRQAEQSERERNIFDRLRSSTLRPTSARVCTLHALLAAPPQGYSADELFEYMTQLGVSISLGTLYRVLKEMEQRGLLQRDWEPGHNGGKASYVIKPDSATQPACRLVCTVCQGGVDVHDAALLKHLARVTRLYDRQMYVRMATIHTICTVCSDCAER